eukprot:m.191644 g.191644  ORF g.191644 m.191644 type:complete len:477 (-) comp18412_c0_seq1:838-2268(-)
MGITSTHLFSFLQLLHVLGQQVMQSRSPTLLAKPREKLGPESIRGVDLFSLQCHVCRGWTGLGLHRSKVLVRMARKQARNVERVAHRVSRHKRCNEIENLGTELTTELLQLLDRQFLIGLANVHGRVKENGSHGWLRVQYASEVQHACKILEVKIEIIKTFQTVIRGHVIQFFHGGKVRVRLAQDATEPRHGIEGGCQEACVGHRVAWYQCQREPVGSVEPRRDLIKSNHTVQHNQGVGLQVNANRTDRVHKGDELKHGPGVVGTGQRPKRGAHRDVGFTRVCSRTLVVLCPVKRRITASHVRQAVQNVGAGRRVAQTKASVQRLEHIPVEVLKGTRGHQGDECQNLLAVVHTIPSTQKPHEKVIHRRQCRLHHVHKPNTCRQKRIKFIINLARMMPYGALQVTKGHGQPVVKPLQRRVFRVVQCHKLCQVVVEHHRHLRRRCHAINHFRKLFKRFHLTQKHAVVTVSPRTRLPRD